MYVSKHSFLSYRAGTPLSCLPAVWLLIQLKWSTGKPKRGKTGEHQNRLHPWIGLEYSWRAWNLNWAIRIYLAGKTALSWPRMHLAGKAVESSSNFFHWIRQLCSQKSIYVNAKAISDFNKRKWERFCVSKVLTWLQKRVDSVRQLALRLLSPGKD